MEFLHFTLIDLIDIILVAAVIFVVFRWIKGSSAMNIFIAIIILFLIRVLATALNMRMISALLGAILDVGALAIIIIFQPEIRRFLNNIGRTAGNNTIIRKLLRRQLAEGLDTDTMSEVVSAVEQMAALHAVPNINVFRPCDATETEAAWYSAVTSEKTPTVLVLTRQNLIIILLIRV